MLRGEIMIARPDPHRISKFISFSRISSLSVVFIGLLVLIGWRSDITVLKGILPGLATMKANTAISFVLSGLSLWLLGRRNSSLPVNLVARFLALATVLIGLLTLMEYLFGWDPGIDLLLFREAQGAEEMPYPGRMSPVTAANFILAGLALLFLDNRHYVWPSQLMSSVAVLTSFLALAGYLYKVKSLYAIASYSSMALHTAILFLVLAFSILLVRPGQGLMAVISSDSMGGMLARRLLPIAAIVPLAAGYLRLIGQQAGFYDTEFGLSLMVVFSTAILVILIGWNVVSLHRTDLERQQVTEEVRRLNEELEERVVERTGRLEAMNKELEAFSYSVSHDLRAPLRAIDGFSRIMLEDCADRLDDEGRRFLNIIRSNTQKMGLLIDDLLAFSRLGRQEIRRMDTDMEALVTSVVESLRATVPERVLQFDVKHLPPAYGDRSMLQQVFMNLLSNAIKYTRPKEKAVIEIGCWSEGDENTYYVKDNGVGFEMEYVNKLFGVFQRLHSEEEFEGTGVGLAIVQRVIHRHSGRVWAEGKLNEGATFYFTLPGGHYGKSDETE